LGVSQARVDDLRRKCGLPLPVCRAALTHAKGNVDAALAALIDAGRVRIEHLDPETVDEGFFGRAEAIARIRQSDEELPKYTAGDSVSAHAREHWRLERKWAAERLKKPRVLRERGSPIRRQLLAKTRPKAAANVEAAPRKPVGPSTVKLAPFPRLKLDDDQWVGRDTLPSWAAFKGRPSVSVEVQRPDDGDPRPPTPEQVAAYRHLKSNERATAEAVLRAVVRHYNALRRKGYFDDDDVKLPDVKKPADLRRHIGPSGVHVLDHAKSGYAYVGLDLHCTWDDEHGLGVLLHRSRVVEVGQADTSFDHHAAKKDGAKKIRQS
jgi:hypothetical protein